MNTPDVSPGDTLRFTNETAIGTVEDMFTVTRTDEDGVYSETAIGERFLPWEALDADADIATWEPSD